MQYVSLSKLRDYFYCPTRAYLRYVCGISLPPTPEMRRGTNLHSFFGSLWRQILALKDKSAVFEALPEFTRAYATKYGLDPNELLTISTRRVDLLWSEFGQQVESRMLTVTPEVVVKSKEFGIVGRIDFVYSTPDQVLLGEVKTGQPHSFDIYQLNAYLAMHDSAQKGFVEYPDAFTPLSFNEQKLSELLVLKQKFEDQEFSKPEYSSKCDSCQYRTFCFGNRF